MCVCVCVCILYVSACVFVCVCVCVWVWVCDIMAGQRGQREMEGVETQRYSLAFIITILPRAERERVRERDRERV